MKYTFEDWLSGELEEEKGINKAGKIADIKYSEGLISDSEYQKIINLQDWAFNKAVEITVKGLLEEFNRDIENSPVPEKLKELKINTLQKRVNESKQKLLKRVYQGETDNLGFTIQKIAEIYQSRDDIKIIHISNPSSIPDENIENRSKNYLASALMLGLGGIIPDEKKKDIPVEPLDFKSVIHNDLYDLTVVFHLLEELQKTTQSNSLKKEVITKYEILKKAHILKQNGHSVESMFKEIVTWLVDENGFSEETVKEQFGISLKDRDSFNRVVNKNAPYNK